MLLGDFTDKNSCISFSAQDLLLAEFAMKLPGMQQAQKYVQRRLKGMAIKKAGQLAQKQSVKQGTKMLSEAYPATAKAIKDYPKAGVGQEAVIEGSQNWMKPQGVVKNAPGAAGTDFDKLMTPKVETPTLRQALEQFGPEGKQITNILAKKQAPSLLEIAKGGVGKIMEGFTPGQPKKMRTAIERGKGRQRIASGALADIGYAPTLHQQFAKMGGNELLYNLGPGIAGQMAGGLAGGAMGGVPGAYLGSKIGETGAVSSIRFLSDVLPQMKKGFTDIDWTGKTPGQKLMATPGALKSGIGNVLKNFDPTEYRRDAIGPYIGDLTGRIPGISGLPWFLKIPTTAGSAIAQTGPIDDMLMRQAKGLGAGSINPVPKAKELGGAGMEATKKIANVFQPYLESSYARKGLGQLRQGRKIVDRAVKYLPDFDEYADLSIDDPRVQMVLDRFGTYMRRTIGKGAKQAGQQA